jgi:hypothetical protein
VGVDELHEVDGLALGARSGRAGGACAWPGDSYHNTGRTCAGLDGTAAATCWGIYDRPKVIIEILKANGSTSKSAPGSPLGNNPGLPFRDPREIPAGSAGEALFG